MGRLAVGISVLGELIPEKGGSGEKCLGEIGSDEYKLAWVAEEPWRDWPWGRPMEIGVTFSREMGLGEIVPWLCLRRWAGEIGFSLLLA